MWIVYNTSLKTYIIISCFGLTEHVAISQVGVTSQSSQNGLGWENVLGNYFRIPLFFVVRKTRGIIPCGRGTENVLAKEFWGLQSCKQYRTEQQNMQWGRARKQFGETNDCYTSIWKMAKGSSASLASYLLINHWLGLSIFALPCCVWMPEQSAERVMSALSGWCCK